MSPDSVTNIAIWRGKKFPRMRREAAAMKGITEMANEAQSLNSLRKELRRDLEVTGNWFMEVLRYPADDSVALLYRARAAYVRITAQDPKPVEIQVLLRRNGIIRKTTIHKRFRRFAYLSNDGTKIKWFKEYGDPRAMSYMTGEFVKTTKYPASEMLHHKIDCGTLVLWYATMDRQCDERHGCEVCRLCKL